MKEANLKAAITLTAFLALFLYTLNLQIKLTDNVLADTKILYNLDSHPDQELITTIQNAHKYVYFVIYTITKENIVDALIAAKLRGLEVRGVLDFNQSIIDQEKPLISRMKKYGIEMKIPFKAEGIIHMKLLVTDNSYATGSFNWTNSATTINDEVLEIGHTESFRKQYLEIFNTVWNKYK